MATISEFIASIESGFASVGAEVKSRLKNDFSNVTNPATARSAIGLGSVNNTSDADKPVSTAQASALGAKADRNGSNVEADAFRGAIGATSADSTQFISGLVYNSRESAVANAEAINAWIASGRGFGALTGGQKLYLAAASSGSSAIIISGAERFVLRTNGTTLVYAWSDLNDLRKMFEVNDCGAIDFGEARIAYDPPMPRPRNGDGSYGQHG